MLLKVEQTLLCVKSEGGSRSTKPGQTDTALAEESRVRPKSLGAENHFLAAWLY